MPSAPSVYDIYPKYLDTFELCTILNLKFDQIHLLPVDMWVTGKQYRPWSNAAECSIWAGSTQLSQDCQNIYSKYDM